MDALTRLKAAVSMAAVKKEVPLPDGSIFEFYMTPMTLAERAKAKQMTKSKDPNDFALRLLINKAKDQNDEPLFHVGNLPELRNELPATLVEQLMVQLIGEDEDEEEDEEGEVQKELDVKSLGEGTKKRRRAAS